MCKQDLTPEASTQAHMVNNALLQLLQLLVALMNLHLLFHHSFEQVSMRITFCYVTVHRTYGKSANVDSISLLLDHVQCSAKKH